MHSKQNKEKEQNETKKEAQNNKNQMFLARFFLLMANIFSPRITT